LTVIVVMPNFVAAHGTQQTRGLSGSGHTATGTRKARDVGGALRGRTEISFDPARGKDFWTAIGARAAFVPRDCIRKWRDAAAAGAAVLGTIAAARL